MELKELTEDQKDEIANTLDMEEFWYSIVHGYIKPECILKNEEDIKRVNEAISILQEFESILPIL